MTTILITGASSGLGAALALHYAKMGITLLLTARNEERLRKVAEDCEHKGAKVHIKALNIEDKGEVESWISTMDTLSPIDLVFANAGISAGTAGGPESSAQVRQIFAVNVDGVLNTLLPLIPRMRERQKGQIVIISSLAGYRGLPSSPAYSASKAAVKLYGEGLRGGLAKDGVGVTVVTPGYIKTPMTDVNQFYMPFLMPVTKAAAIIEQKLMRNPARIAFPLPLYLLVWLMSILPPRWTDPIFSKLPGKAGMD